MRGVQQTKVVQQRRKKHHDKRITNDKRKVSLLDCLPKPGIVSKKLSKEKLRKIRQRVQQRNRLYRIKLWGITLLVAIVLISLALYFNQIILNIEL